MNLPDKLPSSVEKYLETFQTCLAASDQKGEERVARLVSAPEMKKVWSALIKLNPDALNDFIWYAAYSPELTVGANGVPINTPREEQRLLKKVFKAAQALRHSLEDLGGEARKLQGALSRGVGKLGVAATRADVGTYEYQRAPGTPNSMNLAQAINTLLSTAELAASGPFAMATHKLKRTRALRVAYVKGLAGLLQKRFGKPLFEGVATVTNLMFDEWGPALTGKQVRTLVKPPRRIFSSKKVQ